MFPLFHCPFLVIIRELLTNRQATAYRASKVVAEKAAWDFIRENPVDYTLVTLCPGMVFGEMIHPISSMSQLNASNQIVWGVLSAGEEGEIPPTKAPGEFHPSSIIYQ